MGGVPGTLILKTLVGSRAYGLADDDSDWDFHGVFVVPTSTLLSLRPKSKETKWVETPEEDFTAWEIGHFLHLALQCNPTILDTFIAPIVNYGPCQDYSCGQGDTCDSEWCNKWGSELRELFPHVLSRQRIYDSCKNYAKNQLTKMINPKGGVMGGERVWKFSVAYLRVLYHGALLLQNTLDTLEIPNGDFKGFLWLVKDGAVSKGDVINKSEELERDLTQSYLKSPIPEEANIDVVNDFLLRVREEYW